MLLKNATILNDQWKFIAGDLRIENGKICEIGVLSPQEGEEALDLCGKTLIPGLVETHFHGAAGHTTDGGFCEASLDAFSTYQAGQGITTFVPGIGSRPDTAVENFLTVSAQYQKKTPPAAKMGGVYLEGPFISFERRGAHNPAYLQLPSAEKLRRWQALSGGIVKKSIVAPELEGAEETVRAGVECGIVMEIGHSIASYEQAKKAIDWGVTLSTHTFNGMNPFNHRDPGVLGAVLTDDRVQCELIADFGHVAPPAVKLVYLAKGDDKINIVSDSMNAAGLGDGVYTYPDGRQITVSNGIARCANGTISGSACSIMFGLRNLVSIGIPLESAVKMCSYNPAKTIGLGDSIGSISVGKCADLVVLDDALKIEAVYVDGRAIDLEGIG